MQKMLDGQLSQVTKKQYSGYVHANKLKIFLGTHEMMFRSQSQLHNKN
jgi:hypothetical protein